MIFNDKIYDTLSQFFNITNKGETINLEINNKYQFITDFDLDFLIRQFKVIYMKKIYNKFIEIINNYDILKISKFNCNDINDIRMLKIRYHSKSHSFISDNIQDYTDKQLTEYLKYIDSLKFDDINYICLFSKINLSLEDILKLYQLGELIITPEENNMVRFRGNHYFNTDGFEEEKTYSTAYCFIDDPIRNISEIFLYKMSSNIVLDYNDELFSKTIDEYYNKFLIYYNKYNLRHVNDIIVDTFDYVSGEITSIDDIISQAYVACSGKFVSNQNTKKYSLIEIFKSYIFNNTVENVQSLNWIQTKFIKDIYDFDYISTAYVNQYEFRYVSLLKSDEELSKEKYIYFIHRDYTISECISSLKFMEICEDMLYHKSKSDGKFNYEGKFSSDILMIQMHLLGKDCVHRTDDANILKKLFSTGFSHKIIFFLIFNNKFLKKDGFPLEFTNESIDLIKIFYNQNHELTKNIIEALYKCSIIKYSSKLLFLRKSLKSTVFEENE